MKRVFIIIASIIILIGVGIGVYFFFFASSSPHLTVGDSTNPFGDTSAGAATKTPVVSQVGVSVSTAGTVVAPNLVQITKSPVAQGAADFDVTAAVSITGSSTVSTSTDVKVRYIDRQSGNIYEYGALSRTLTRLSDKTLPGIQEASWTPDGSMVFARFLAKVSGQQTLDTYALPANGIGGYFLPQNLSQASVVGSSTLFTLAQGSDSSIGTISGVDGSSPRSIFSSPLTQFVVTASHGTYIAVTKASASLPGYIFSVGSSFTPIIGPYNGLTALISPSGSQLLYSYTDGSAYHMAILNLANGSVTALPIATLAEKCVWKADSSALFCAVPTAFSGNLPDDWYQGAVSFSDRIWKIDLASHLATLVLDPATTVKNGIDAVSLSIDPNGQVLVFTNKKDLSLWSYSL
jgi:hypothetical protein